MIYKVLMDGRSIYESDGNVAILEPKLEQEVNTAGSFDFTVPRNHAFYDDVTLLTPEIEVYESDELIFFGRPTEIEMDIDLQLMIHCEGALAYFNDSVIAPFEFNEIERTELLEYFVNQHNANVPENRRFQIGNVTMPLKYVYRKVEKYTKTLDCLNEYLLDSEGGYLMVRKENGIRYIDWFDSIPYRNTQPVRFALNLMTLSQKVNADFVTSVIPIGANELTIASVNGGRVYLDSDEYISQYGRITGIAEFSDVENPETLMALGEYYLETQDYGRPSINVTAAELHYINDEYTPFRIGEKVQVSSTPHSLEAVLPIVKLTINLDKADKEIEIGTLDRRSLTELVNDGSGTMVSGTTFLYDETPTAGSNKAVTSAGIFAALGPLRFSVNEDGTVTVREVSSGEVEG